MRNEEELRGWSLPRPLMKEAAPLEPSGIWCCCAGLSMLFAKYSATYKQVLQEVEALRVEARSEYKETHAHSEKIRADVQSQYAKAQEYLGAVFTLADVKEKIRVQEGELAKLLGKVSENSEAVRLREREIKALNETKKGLQRANESLVHDGPAYAAISSAVSKNMAVQLERQQQFFLSVLEAQKSVSQDAMASQRSIAEAGLDMAGTAVRSQQSLAAGYRADLRQQTAATSASLFDLSRVLSGIKPVQISVDQSDHRQWLQIDGSDHRQLLVNSAACLGGVPGAAASKLENKR